MAHPRQVALPVRGGDGAGGTGGSGGVLNAAKNACDSLTERTGRNHRT
jgi:hypothetical protein